MRVLYFKEPATSEIYTLSLHDALPISLEGPVTEYPVALGAAAADFNQNDFNVSGALDDDAGSGWAVGRSEEHTSELQSLRHLVCRLLLEKKNKTIMIASATTTT